MRKCATTNMPVLFLDPLWLKSQLSLFAGGHSAVQHPGARGGQFHVDEHGTVRYGDTSKPGGYRTADHAAAAAHHRGEASSRFTLDPPEVGETRSGKAIPHHEDPSAYHANGEHKDGAFKGWSADDHRDAAEVHDKYSRYFAARGRTELADGHGRASHRHLRVAEPGRHSPQPAGVTKSGKAIPHVDDERAYARGDLGKRTPTDASRQPGGAFHGWSADDHLDAAEHYHNMANTPTGANESHREAARHHYRLADRAPEHAKLPPAVKAHVEHHLKGLRHHAASLEHGRNTDRQFGGGGRYEHDVWLNNGMEAAVAGHHKALAEFHHHAPKNGVDADKVLHELGGVPDVKLSPKAEEYRRR